MKNSRRKVEQSQTDLSNLNLPTSIKKKYFITLGTLIILSLLNLSWKSGMISSNLWSFSIDLKVTPVTLTLVFFFWLPVLLPWILTQFPQLQDSLNWLREQEVEEIETNLLRIKLRYGVKEASQSYEEEIADAGASNASLSSQEALQEIIKRYQEMIASVEATTAPDIDSRELLKRIDQLADYYDRIRKEMPAGSHRTKLMIDISSTLWTLVIKTDQFPVWEKLCSYKPGERLSAYKYLEWQPSTDYLEQLLARSIGILEQPFGQYNALLALRRMIIINQLTPAQSQWAVSLLEWSANLDYVQGDTSRHQLILEIVSMLKANL